MSCGRAWQIRTWEVVRLSWRLLRNSRGTYLHKHRFYTSHDVSFICICLFRCSFSPTGPSESWAKSSAIENTISHFPFQFLLLGWCGRGKSRFWDFYWKNEKINYRGSLNGFCQFLLFFESYSRCFFILLSFGGFQWCLWDGFWVWERYECWCSSSLKRGWGDACDGLLFFRLCRGGNESFWASRRSSNMEK